MSGLILAVIDHAFKVGMPLTPRTAVWLCAGLGTDGGGQGEDRH